MPGISFRACRGDRLDLHRAAVDDAYPGHLELTLLDRDQAGFPEELIAIAHTHDERVDAAQNRVHARQPPDLFSSFSPCSRANAMLAATSLRSFIHRRRRSRLLSRSARNEPTALPAMRRGRAAGRLDAEVGICFLVRDCCADFHVAHNDRVAADCRRAPCRSPEERRRSQSRFLTQDVPPAPADATGRKRISFSSTMPIHAKGIPPVSL